MAERDDLVCIIDNQGRCLIGSQTEQSDPNIIHLINPIILVELVDQRERKVHLAINPLFHNFDIQEIDCRWTHRLKMTENMKDLYLEHLTKLRAARSGIEVVDKIPQDVRSGN